MRGVWTLQYDDLRYSRKLKASVIIVAQDFVSVAIRCNQEKSSDWNDICHARKDSIGPFITSHLQRAYRFNQINTYYTNNFICDMLLLLSCYNANIVLSVAIIL